MHKYSLFLNIWFGHRLCSTLATKRITRIKFSSYNLVHSVGNSMAGVELDGGEDSLTGWGSWGSSHSNWGSSISSWGDSGNSWGSSIGSWGNSSNSWGSSIGGSGNSWGSSIDSLGSSISGNSWGSNSWGSNNWGSGISSRGNSSHSRGSSIGGSSKVVRSICREGRGSGIGVVESVSFSRPLDLSSSIVGLKEAGLGSSNLRGVSYGKGSHSIVDRGSRGKSTVDRGNREVVTGHAESEVISNVVDSVDSSLISIGVRSSNSTKSITTLLLGTVDVLVTIGNISELILSLELRSHRSRDGSSSSNSSHSWGSSKGSSSNSWGRSINSWGSSNSDGSRGSCVSSSIGGWGSSNNRGSGSYGSSGIGGNRG